MIVVRTGYTSKNGFEIFPPTDHAVGVRRAIITADGKVENLEDPTDNGADLGLPPCDLAYRGTLRLEAGVPLYDYELTRDRAPLETDLKSIMRPTKGQSIGQNALANRLQSKELLVGLRFSGGKAPKCDIKLIDAEGNEIGALTSAKASPILGHPIGLTYVQHRQPATGTRSTAKDTDVTATVVPTPFYNHRHRK